MSFMRIKFIVVLVVGVCSISQGKTIVVTPLTMSIQEALDSAQNGDTVLALPGTYSGDGNRDISFKGKSISLVSVFGADSTIIDIQATQFDLHRGFWFHSGEDSASLLEGFTITGGNPPTEGAREISYGGAIRCDSSSPTLRNLVIRRNRAIVGAGMYLFASSPTLVDCEFSADTTLSSNFLSNGGGINMQGKLITIAYQVYIH